METVANYITHWYLYVFLLIGKFVCVFACLYWVDNQPIIIARSLWNREQTRKWTVNTILSVLFMLPASMRMVMQVMTMSTSSGQSLMRRQLDDRIPIPMADPMALVLNCQMNKLLYFILRHLVISKKNRAMNCPCRLRYVIFLFLLFLLYSVDSSIYLSTLNVCILYESECKIHIFIYHFIWPVHLQYASMIRCRVLNRRTIFIRPRHPLGAWPYTILFF